MPLKAVNPPRFGMFVTSLEDNLLIDFTVCTFILDVFFPLILVMFILINSRLTIYIIFLSFLLGISVSIWILMGKSSFIITQAGNH